MAAWRPLLSSWAIHSEAVRLPAAVWILGISLAPLVFFFASQGIRGISGDLLDAARTLGVRERTIALRIILPLAAPMISTGAAIAFVLALLDQETPSLLLVPAYSTEIFLRMGRGPGAAFAASVPVILLAAVLVTAAWSWARRRGFSVTAGENPRTPFPARRIDPLAVAVLLASFGLLVLFPLVRLLQMAGSARIFQEAWALYGPAFLEAVPVTLGGALGATVLAALILGRRGETGTAGALLAWIPLAVPGTALAAAFIEAWNRPGLDAVYKSPWILVAAGAVRLFPIAFHALAAHLRTVPPALWEAADLAAVPALRRFLRVWLPLAAPGLALAACAGVVLQVGEVAAAVLLAPPGHRPPSVVISAELHYNVNLDVPAALCLFQVAAVLIMIACIRIPARLLAPPAARDGG